MPVKFIEDPIALKACGHCGEMQAIVDASRRRLNPFTSSFTLPLIGIELRCHGGEGVIIDNMGQGDRIFKQGYGPLSVMRHHVVCSTTY
ncbi:hypothetical protein D8L93_05220 [Sodalis-like symbiont of Bactericera trigonica]|nr:hypothetical protein D8L93_05220 [Sodalis-like symbiont of Bactericera trigonica]